MRPALLRLPAVINMTGLSRSTIYRLIGAGQFPPCIKLTERSSAWCTNEIDSWIEARRANRDAQLAA